MRPLIAIASICALFSAASATRSDKTVAAELSNGKHVNVILINADDLGYGDLGCYGQKNFATPNLDRLAAEGMRFTQAYSGSTVCAPSRCALMTGLHTGHARIRGNAQVSLRDEDVTIAEILKPAGYKTAHIGKWGCAMPRSAGEPHKQGFDYWLGYVTNGEAHNYYPAFLWKNGERMSLENDVVKGVSTNKAVYTPEMFTAEALRFIEQSKSEPFFLYLAYTQPHANNEAGNKGMEVPELGEYAAKDWPEPEKGRAAMIAYMDRDVGRIMARLKELNIDENTVVMFTSDNGPHKEGGSDPAFHDCNGPLRGIKRDLYDGGIRVPLIVRWPSKVKAGQTSNHICAHWDILTTITDIAGIESPRGLDGISFKPTLLGSANEVKQVQHEFLYWEFHERGFQQAARMGKWKGVLLKHGGKLELYDLENDIGEENDISEKHPEVAARIEAYLKTARTENPQWQINPEPRGKRK